MNRKLVISHSSLPVRSPLLIFAVLYLMLDRYSNLPGWAWGVFWTLVVILYAGFLVARYLEVYVTVPLGSLSSARGPQNGGV